MFPTFTKEVEGNDSNIPYAEQTGPMDQEASTIFFFICCLGLIDNVVSYFSDYSLQCQCNMAEKKSDLFNLLHHGRLMVEYLL